MTFDDVVLPDDCMNGARMELMDGNDISSMGSGATDAVQKWPWPRKRLTLPFENMYRRDTTVGGIFYTGFQSFCDFVVLRGSTARAFKAIDPSHYFRQNQNIGQGDGANTIFQLSYSLKDSANAVPARPIYHPMPTGTVLPEWRKGEDTGDPNTAVASAACIISLGAVWKIHIAGGPTGGKTTLHWNSLNADVPYNATQAQVIAAFALLGIVAVCKGGNLPGTDITIGVVTPTGVQTLPTWTDAFTGGTAPATTVSQLAAGKALTEGPDFTLNTYNGQITCSTAPADWQVVYMVRVWFYTCMRFFQYLDITMNGIYAKFAAVLIEEIVEDWH